MNPHLRARLEGIQKQLIAHHTGGTGMPNAMIGNERETLIREFLAKVYPDTFRFGTGAITDSNNLMSGQADVVIELPFEATFPMPAGKQRLYPAESVGAVVEVKSNISSQWNQLINTTKTIKQLNRQIKAVLTIGSGNLNKIPVFGVGYTGYTNTKTIQKKLEETPKDSRPDGILVIDSGCFIGSGFEATGCWGLYGLIMAIQLELGRVKVANSNLIAYVQDN